VIHDGDTLSVRLSLDFGMSYTHPLRLYGVNCPELPTPAGIAAHNYTLQWLIDHPAPYTFTKIGAGADKYGRLLGRFRAADGHCLNDDLLAAGQAVVMKG
jgi:endonuclease YncB( thermonuclease family)